MTEPENLEETELSKPVAPYSRCVGVYEFRGKSHKEQID